MQVQTSSVAPTCGNCNGTASALPVNGTFPYTYTWLTGGQTTSSVSGLCPGTYSVVVKDNLPSSLPDTNVINITDPNALSANVVSSNSVTCNGGSNGAVTVSAVNGTQPYTYSWSTGSTSFGISGLTAGSYSVAVHDASGCMYPLTVNISQPPPMQLQIDSVFPAVCLAANGRVYVQGSGGVSPYQYQWSGGHTSNAYTGLSAGNYSVTITDANSCTANLSVNLPMTSNGTTVNPISTTSVSCNGYADGAAEVLASGGDAPYQYTWNTGQTKAQVTGLRAASYSVTATDANGCTAQTSLSIVQPAALSFTLNTTSVKCFGEQNGEAQVNVSGGASGFSYAWSSGQTSSQVSALAAGSYSLVITDANSCTTTIPVTITEPAKLNVQIPNVPDVCEGSVANININIVGGTQAYTFNWNTGSNQQNIQVSPTSSTSYSVAVMDANGCSDSSSITINVNPLPIVTFDADVTEGCPELCVNFNNTSSIAAQSQWNFGDGNSSAIQSPSNCYEIEGTYSVSLTVTDANGCSNTLTKSKYITVYPQPIASFVASPQPATILSPLISFRNTSDGASQWLWNFGDASASTSSVEHPQFIYDEEGTYEVTLIVTNEYACSDTAIQEIRINSDFAIYIPNTFTPNNDGLNDTFFPVLSTEVKDVLFQVYDRWGMKLYETSDITLPWDGSVNGGDVAQIDTYVWRLYITELNGEHHDLVGRVNLIR